MFCTDTVYGSGMGVRYMRRCPKLQHFANPAEPATQHNKHWIGEAKVPGTTTFDGMSDNGPPPALCRAYDRAMARFDVSQCSVLDVMSGVPLYPPVLCVRFAQSKKWKALERWAAARYLKACPGKYMTHTYKPSW